MDEQVAIAPTALLTLEEARSVLRIARSTLYEIIGDGDLEVVEVRGRRFIEPATLSAFIQQGRRRGAATP